MTLPNKYCYTKNDFKIEWFSGTGPGGQNRNKTQNCVRITHLPSGLKQTSARHRNRTANFRDAFRALGKAVEIWVQQQLYAENLQRTTSDETIRTYHFVDNRVKDHLSLVQITIDELEKKFGELIAARNHAKIINEKESNG